MAPDPRTTARPKPDGQRPTPADAPRAKATEAVRAKSSDAARTMSDAQREYERKRAQKAGMSLDKWLEQKHKQAVAEAPKVAKPPRKKGLLSRLIDKAHEPLKKKS